MKKSNSITKIPWQSSNLKIYPKLAFVKSDTLNMRSYDQWKNWLEKQTTLNLSRQEIPKIHVRETFYTIIRNRVSSPGRQEGRWKEHCCRHLCSLESTVINESSKDSPQSFSRSSKTLQVILTKSWTCWSREIRACRSWVEISTSAAIQCHQQSTLQVIIYQVSEQHVRVHSLPALKAGKRIFSLAPLWADAVMKPPT